MPFPVSNDLHDLNGNNQTSQLQDKNVLIHGASSGIGEATALLLARKGVQVVLGAYRLIGSGGGTAELCRLDVTNLEDMQSFAVFGLARVWTC